MMAVTYFAGVTSKAGLEISAAEGVICLPLKWVTSLAARSSMGICSPVGGRHVDGGPGSGHVERDAVFLGEDGDAVGANFVGDVTVGGDAIRADDDGFDFSGAHLAGGHVVAENGGGDVVMQQFPRGKARTLQERARFIGVDMQFASAFDRGANHAEGSSIAAGGERARIAMRQDTTGARHQHSAEGTHGAAGGDVFVIHAARFGHGCLLNLRHGGAGFLRHGDAPAGGSVQFPRKVDGGGTGGGEGVANDFQIFVELGDVGCLAALQRRALRPWRR